MELGELARLRRRELERLYAAGAAPRIDELVGWEFRGVNPPAWARAVGIGKFVKGFFKGESGAEGYNVWCSQKDWRRLRRGDRDLRHGYYLVRPGHGRFEEAVVLDYGASKRNPAANPERLLFDVLVHPDPTDHDLLLGKAYLRVGPLLPVSFFLLQKDREAGV